MSVRDIEYSEKYYDDEYEYRHVVLPKQMGKQLAENPRLLKEEEWRALGVRQSRGWVHYLVHKPEPHILLFRRKIGTDPRTGEAPDRPMTAEEARQRDEQLQEQLAKQQQQQQQQQ
ncbi:MAG: Cyclin-dependent kinases regulatory subunit (Cell division control protein cks1) [Cercozoa sp. M6MM]